MPQAARKLQRIDAIIHAILLFTFLFAVINFFL